MFDVSALATIQALVAVGAEVVFRVEFSLARWTLAPNLDGVSAMHRSECFILEGSFERCNTMDIGSGKVLNRFLAGILSCWFDW